MKRTGGSRGIRAVRRMAGLVVLAVVGLTVGGVRPAVHADVVKIQGDGSSWAAVAINSMRANIAQYGISVDYADTGSTVGRSDFLNDSVDFAASDIPFQFHPEDGSQPEKAVPGTYAYIPVVAGGTSFMYNLKVNGQQVTNLRLSGTNITKIFTGAITMWNDPAIQADNPGLTMPARTIVPVVRSDGSGSTFQLTAWMISQHADIWNPYCQKASQAAACGATSFYPSSGNMIAQSKDSGVAAYVAAPYAEGAIGYVNYSYAILNNFPVAKMLNTAGYYVEPTPENVAVSLLKAQINNNAADPTVYLTQDLSEVYVDPDPRAYPLSSYSYLIVHTTTTPHFDANKGETLGEFAFYAMCEAQRDSATLGYSPIPINLVQASFEQIRKIPGVTRAVDVNTCNNPTFAPDGSNLLADNAPQPQLCDQQGASQCPDGTGGLSGTPTAVSSPPPDAGAGASGGSGSGGGGSGGGGSGAVTGGGSGAAATGAGSGGDASGSGAATGGGSTGGAGSGGSPSAGNGATGGGATPGGASGSGGSPTPGAGDATVTTVATGSADAGATTTTAPAAGAGGSSTGSTRTGGLVTATTECDPDTGSCGSAGDAKADAAPAAAGPVRSTLLDQRSGWNTSLLLVIVVIALVVALVFGPALAWRYYAKARTR